MVPFHIITDDQLSIINPPKKILISEGPDRRPVPEANTIQPKMTPRVV